MKKLMKIIKVISTIGIVIRNLMPVSKITFYRQNLALLQILESHKEFQMINRQDIMTLASQMVAKTQTANPVQQAPGVKKIDEGDVMYG